MFIVREYAACLLVVLLAAALLFAGCGTFLALRAGYRAAAKALRLLRRMRDREAHVARTASLVAILLLMIPPKIARANEAGLSPSAQDDGYTIRISVGQVVLYTSVRNSKGTPVSGLAKGNFQVYEDGALQEIKFFSHEDIPVEVGLIVDNSGSMRPKRAEVITAALAFARSSNPQDQMFVINFNEHVLFGLPQNVPFTDQAAQLESALSRVSADGETALYDALAAFSRSPLGQAVPQKVRPPWPALGRASQRNADCNAHTLRQSFNLADPVLNFTGILFRPAISFRATVLGLLADCLLNRPLTS
jgi:von Willebrand factor type A domain